MDIVNLPIAEVLTSLNSSERGLDAFEADRRLAEYGPNRIEEVKGRPPWLRFLGEFTHFFALILWVATALAAFAEWRNPGEGMGTLALAILAVIVVNGVFSFGQDYRAERAIAALRRLLPPQAKVLRDGELQAMEAALLVPGDVVLLEEGDNVPADCRLIAAAMTVFFAVLNGAGWRYGEALARADPLYLQATTACLAAIVVSQVVNVFLCRHPEEGALRFRPADNPLLLAGIAFEARKRILRRRRA